MHVAAGRRALIQVLLVNSNVSKRWNACSRLLPSVTTPWFSRMTQSKP
jgi:hypothetical protein